MMKGTCLNGTIKFPGIFITPSGLGAEMIAFDNHYTPLGLMRWKTPV
jgi:hypothetical protein